MGEVNKLALVLATACLFGCGELVEETKTEYRQISAVTHLGMSKAKFEQTLSNLGYADDPEGGAYYAPQERPTYQVGKISTDKNVSGCWMKPTGFEVGTLYTSCFQFNEANALNYLSLQILQ